MIKSLFLRWFTWWNGHTVGTGLFTRWKGQFVGSDDGGNKYYRERGGPKRWVLYNGEVEASRIPPEWHAWLHFMTPLPPTEAPLETKSWEKGHAPNMTGTPNAYFPPGSLGAPGKRQKTAGDYEAWRP